MFTCCVWFEILHASTTYLFLPDSPYATSMTIPRPVETYNGARGNILAGPF